MDPRPCFVSICASLLLSWVCWAESGAPPPDGGAVAEAPPSCLDCHGDPEAEIELDSEEVLSLFVDEQLCASSVHREIECTECHTHLKGKENGHKSKTLATKREYAVKLSEQCKDCHFQNYTKTLDSVHHALIAKGKLDAAVCTDCHGAHDTGPAAEPRSRISRTCARCHPDVAKAYALSVHGSALLEQENPDVPNCTDCHRAHDILDPRRGEWRLGTPQMCGACHSNKELMKKYGLSTEVVSTYLADFHGSTTLLQRSEKNLKPTVALCTDCHGVHDIARLDAAGTKAMQANLGKTCEKCHSGSNPNFPAAWLGHYEPTWEKAPAVFLVASFYDFLIPFMISGLVLQIALHLWRVVVNR